MTPPAGYRVRPARPSEFPLILAVEADASTLFEGWAIASPDISEEEALAALERCHEAGTLWVAGDAQDRPVGFLAAHELDGALYVLELDVARAHQRRGVGSALLAAAIDHARWAFYPAVALTTDRVLPWNAPFYAQHGFVGLRSEALSPGLKAKLDGEIARGHDPARRVAMAKVL